MPCDTYTSRGQTLKERIAEVGKVVDTVAAGVRSGRIKVKVGPQGAVAFEGLTDAERNRVTDACILRRSMVKGDAGFRMAIARAEQLAGRGVSKQAVAQGIHSHDGGGSWHGGH